MGLAVVVFHADALVAQGPVAAIITSPVNGSTNADFTQPVRWTSVPDALTYYLYVGVTPGSNGLVNSGETQATSYPLPLTLPRGQTLYARLWTKRSSGWTSSDATFSSNTAGLTYPANGATNVDLLHPIQWTPVPGVQSYYLYVGSTVGAKDLLNTGEIQTTSVSGSNLPTGRTLYARLWTRIAGAWTYSDSQFASYAAVITYPTYGASNVDLSKPIQWTPVTGVQAYYLYVGSTLGAKDLINTGEIQATSVSGAGLPRGQTLYARLWTKVANAWSYSDSQFASTSAAITYPANGASNVDLSKPIQWTTVPGVQAYYLYVGSTIGAKDLMNTGETQATSVSGSGLPRGQILYARLWTRVANAWSYSDSEFSSNGATIIYPPNGTTSALLSNPVQWSVVPGAQAYELSIGSSPGASDLLSTGDILQTSYFATNLPLGQVMYARIGTKVANAWSYTDSTFTSNTSTITYPPNGAIDVDLDQPIQWRAVPNVDAYYLYVGTSPGAKDLINTGEIQATSYAAAKLPRSRTVYARLWTKKAGKWTSSDSTFSGASFGRLLQVENLVHVGAFRVPQGLVAGSMGAGFDYGGTAIAFNPANNSLFLVGHTIDQLAAEITIPDVTFGSPTATLLQPLTDPLEGKRWQINPSDPNPKNIGGILPTPSGLIISAYSFYDGLNTQTTSHFRRPTDLSVTGQVAGPFKVGNIGPGFVSGYMAMVPPSLQAALGGPVLAGQGAIPVINRTSFGPGVGTMNPVDIGVKNPVPWHPLVYYPVGHETLGLWAQSNPLFGGSDQVTGVVLPYGTSTILFFGRHGDTFCYGAGTGDLSLVGTFESPGDIYCYDPVDSSKGVHGFPYRSYVWAYDVNDLINVVNGTKQPWEIVPYATWTLDALGGARIGGATYDPQTGRIFVSQLFGDFPYPLIHVYNIQ